MICFHCKRAISVKSCTRYFVVEYVPLPGSFSIRRDVIAWSTMRFVRL